MKRILLATAALLALTACRGGDGDSDTSTDNSECGDVDGPEGEVPNVLGNWTGDFGKNLYADYCTEVNAGSEFPIDGALEIGGRIPNTLYATIDSLGEDTRFYGLVSPTGGIVFAGEYTDRHGTWDISFGGLVYYDPIRDRDVIDGFGFAGLQDPDSDAFACDARGEWTAFKSGL